MFNEAQDFFIDPATVGNATEIQVSKIDVYFKQVPMANGNKSGIFSPGATMYLVPTANGVPVIDNLATAPTTRVEYNLINPSTDATQKTSFVFANSSPVKTGKFYAWLLAYDGDEDFVIWKDTVGEDILGTTTISTGPSGKFVGNYYTYISPVPVANGQTIASGTGIVSQASTNNSLQTTVANSTYIAQSWRPVVGVCAKFTVYAQRYAFNGNTNLTGIITANNQVVQPANSLITTPLNPPSVGNNGVCTFNIPAQNYEFITYDPRYSQTGNVMIGERCWQKYPFYPNDGKPSTVSVTANNNLVTSANVNFKNMFVTGQQAEYIVIVSKNHDGPGLDRSLLRQVKAVQTNNSIIIDEPMTWTNTGAYFYKAPVGRIDSFQTYNSGQQNMVTLRGSNANVAYRFSNNRIETCGIANSGTGYSNSDVIIFKGFEYIANAVTGGSNAYANIVTSNTGAIVNVYMSAYGCGFVNGYGMSIANSLGGNTAGTGFLPIVNPNSTVYIEHQYNGTAGSYVSCKVINLDIHDAQPGDFVENPLGTFYNMFHNLCFYKIADSRCFSGFSYHCDTSPSQNDCYPVKPSCNTGYNYSKLRCHVSWSNEVAIMQYSNTIQCNSTVITVNAVANGDYTSVCTDDGSVTFSQFIINNDYTNEHTNYGNAQAKGVSTKITFANDHYAEDIRVYVTAYRPVGTDVQMYVRIYNTHDSDTFDDKDWTRLQLIDGVGLYSSQASANSYVELTYGFQNCPNLNATFAGSATLTLNSANVVGAGTTWDTGPTANLNPGDLVKITQPLFPNNNIVTMVTAVANDSFFTIQDPISNNGLVGPGLTVQKIGFPHQAFNNPLNENVVRYYSSSMAYYDTFNVMQLKPVLLTSNTCLIPHLDDIRAVGVSS